MDTSDLEVTVAEQLQDLVIGSDDVNAFLEDLCEMAAAAASEAVGLRVLCAITLTRQRRTATIAGSSPEATLLDEVQRAYGEGPCLHAMATKTTVVVDDTRTDQRWIDYCLAIAGRGQLSVLAVPLELDEGATAALNLFAPTPDAFNARAITQHERFAAQAQKAVRLAVRIGSKQELVEDLRAAMKSRTDIDLACGIIMGQNRCSQEEAFRILQRVSSNRNVKLRVLAEDLIRGLSHGPATSHFDE